MNSATQNAIGYAPARLLDTTKGDSDDVSFNNQRIVYCMSREILQYQWCTNRPLVRRELAQGTCNVGSSGDQEQVPFAKRNGKPNKSDGSDTQVVVLTLFLSIRFQSYAVESQIQTAKKRFSNVSCRIQL